MSYNLLIASSLEEAKKLNPEMNSFVVIEEFVPGNTENWKDSEASSLPASLLKYREKTALVIKITERKVKFYCLIEGKSLCTTDKYHEALEKLDDAA